MKRLLSASLAMLIFAPATIALTPTNDFFATRMVLSGTNVTVHGDNTNATEEENEPTGSEAQYLNHSLWYTWVAPTSGVVRASITSSVDHMVTAFGGNFLGAHQFLSSPAKDTGNIYIEEGVHVHFAVQTVYWLIWGGGGWSGPFDLNIQFQLAQPTSTNDNFADSISITNFPYAFEGNLRGATREENEPLGLYTDSGSQSLWWSFVPTELGILNVSAQSDTWGPRLVFYRGTNLSSLAWISTADGPAQIYTEPGAEYKIQLTTRFTAGGPDTFSLAATFTPQPVNDNFTNTIQLEGNSQAVSSWILSPTVEPGETLLTNIIEGTLWWSWAASADGRAVVTPISYPASGGFSKIRVYTGPTVDQLTPTTGRRSSTDGPFTFSAKAGAVYHIQVWARTNNISEQTGFDLALFPFAAATNDNFADAATAIPGILGAKSNIGATRELGEPIHRIGGTNKSLWWRWPVGMNTAGSSVQNGQGTITNLTIAVYKGSTIDTLSLIGKSATRVTFDTIAGEPYYIAAETDVAEMGDIELRFTLGRGNATPVLIPGNLVLDPSFEQDIPVWGYTNLGGVFQETGADGRNFVFAGAGGKLWQSIPTAPGEQYRLRFAYAKDQEWDGNLRVSFAGQILGTNSATGGPRVWRAAEYFLTATTNQSLLLFEGLDNLVDIDQISLIWLNQPPAFVTQPKNATAFAGADAAFIAGVTGSPISYQWYFENSPLQDATQNFLKFSDLNPTNSGTYFLRATNLFGAVNSDHVTLTVESALSPQIVLQPQSDVLFPGQFYVLQIAAVGTPPLSYQWFRDGSAMTNATNNSIIFSAFTATDTGSYTAQVANAGETVTSLPATLTLAETSPAGGGAILFANSSGFFHSISAPVFDVDGFTRLSGSNFVAQLYAGPSAETLRPVGPPQSFLTGFNHGFWRSTAVQLPNVAPGAIAHVQARVWDNTIGSSYETTRALGGRFGRSAILQIEAAYGSFPPTNYEAAPMTGLTSFSLQSGLPGFVTGQLSLLETQQDGSLLWRLTGASGFRYLVERKTDGANWFPFQTLTNQTGQVTFSDTPNTNATIQIYRARMLD